MVDKVNLAEKFAQFSDTYSPKIVGAVNDSLIKVVKLKGDFVWHHHETEDEMFLVVRGRLIMHFRERTVEAARCTLGRALDGTVEILRRHRGKGVARNRADRKDPHQQTIARRQWP